MNNKVNKAKNFVAVLMVVLVLFVYNQYSFVLAQTAPEPPAPPSAPEAPSAPSAPESPSDNNWESENQGGGDEENHRRYRDDDEEDENENTQSETTNHPSPTTESSGNEDGSGNVGDTQITTGDAVNDAGITTSANENYSGSSLLPQNSGGGASVSNKDNGSGSTNSGSVSLTNDDTTQQTNSTVVGNNLWQETETGDNSASRNVGNSTINTGDANTTGTIITSVNTNIDGLLVNEFNVADDHVGDIILDFGSCIFGCAPGDLTAQNSGNGTGSNNQAEIDSNVDSFTFQNNDAVVENNMTLSSDSGHNDADRNTGGDSEIVTGDANVSANALTFANNNISGNVIYSVVNIFGKLIGDILLPEGFCCFNTVSAENSGNGSESLNIADINLTNTDLTYQFNAADIQNNLILYANTGENDTSKNTGGTSSIKTGSASAKAQVVNVANTNIDGGDWWLVIVNEAGNWVGKIIGAPLGSLFGGSEGFVFGVSDSGEITATNSGNGSDSQNTSGVSQQTSNTTIQNNDATIVNNLDLSANTGANSASRNTGGDSTIKTGDANIIANLVNFVNNNIVGTGKLFVTVVNVFGSWLGDFVGPGMVKENDNNSQQALGGPAPSQESSVGGNGNSQSKSSTVANVSLTQNPLPSSSTPDSSENYILGILNTSDVGVSGGEGEGEIAVVAGTNTLSQDSTQGKKVVKINLAWLLFGIPMVALYLIRRKRLNADHTA